MSRVVFAGPSLYGVARPVGVTIAPPAAQGDLVAAVSAGATHIGLVDGYFGDCASVWHKEILYALSQGCRVFGAASMGALRAAECWTFGMEPVGTIAAAYIASDLTDDADVALTHGPAEFDYVPFTEPLVEVRATLNALSATDLLASKEAGQLLSSANNLHFTERTLEALVGIESLAPQRQREILTAYERHAVRVKSKDAGLLLEVIQWPEAMAAQIPDWTLNQSPALSRLLSKA